MISLTVGIGIFYSNQSLRAESNPIETTESKTLYTCGMHPQVIQDHPGDCPICSMKLTPVRKQPASSTALSGGRKITHYKSSMNSGEISENPGKDSMGMEMVPVYEDVSAESQIISIDPSTVQTMGIRTGTVTKGPLSHIIHTVASIDFDETAMVDVTTKFKGWVEKLYVDSTGIQVHRGDALFEIYSPDLYSAQMEYVLSLNQSENSSNSVNNSALTKLKFMDVSDSQIEELNRTRKPGKTMKIYAPRDGIVVEKMVVEGQMIDAGMKLYRLVNLSTVWVQAQIYEQDLQYIRLGQEAVVKLSYETDREFRGRVTYIYPTVDEKTRTARMRMEFHNPGYFLKPGMYATAELKAQLSPSALLVLDSAILRSGQKNTVFVALDGGRFEPRTVTLGPRSDDNCYQVFSGLSEGERVVISGQFMLDSESQLREAIQKMTVQKMDSTANNPITTTNVSTNSNTKSVINSGEYELMTYICPMPEHVAITYKHPGKCPICAMTLIPVSEKTLEKIRPGGKVEYYTCPMTDNCPVPGHGAIKYEKPGKCTVCGMTLVPVMESATNKQQVETIDTPLSHPALYTCPMESHSEVVSDQPGDCPKCGMHLVNTGTVEHGKIAEQNWLKSHPSTPSVPQH